MNNYFKDKKYMKKNDSNNNILKLGFIGGSLNSAIGYTHFVACKMDNSWILEAGCFSKDIKMSRKTAEVYGVASDRVYDNWHEMLKQEKGHLDAIVILTPTPTHYEIVLECLNNEFSIICEKSMTLTYSEAENIIKVRNNKNGFLLVTYNYTGYPMVRELRNLIRKGTLGKIIHFQAEMPQEGYIRIDSHGNKPTPQSWRLSDGIIPTIHLDLAVHLHQAIYYIIEQYPIEVISDQNSFGWFPEIVDNVSCLCRYSENIQGQIWFSKSALGHRNGLKLRIYGTKGSAEWYQAYPEELKLYFSDGRREIIDRAAVVEVANMKRYNRFKAGHPAGFIEAYANLYVDIADCVRQYKKSGHWESENIYGAELAMQGLQMFEAMTNSIIKKCWQRIES